MKKKLLFCVIITLGLTVRLLTSCESETVITPLNNGTNIRNLILVISDIHLGDDANYEQCNSNRAHLVNFLEQVRNSPNVKELVIAGDLFDEWFIPDTINTYRGVDQKSFVKRIVETNKPVFDGLNNIIKDGKILVTYTPGNHDLLVEASNVEIALPGVNQARDEGLLGLGTYSPENHPEIAIEHGHRYNFFCAPDPISNQSIAAGTILPPGYFFTRIAATHLYSKCTYNVDTLPLITPNESGDASQAYLYDYWTMWAWAMKLETIGKPFSEKSIITNVNGFKGNYCVNDIVPYQLTPGGKINVNLYNGIQDNWETRCNLNHVQVPISTDYAINYANGAIGTDTMAYWQYFNNPAAKKRIVVFGHSHVAKMINYTIAGKKFIYANSGTWIDDNPLSNNGMNAIIITPQNNDPNSNTHVRLYNFKNSRLELLEEDSLKL